MLVVQPKVTIVFKFVAVKRCFFFVCFVLFFVFSFGNFKYIEIFLYVIYCIKGILKRMILSPSPILRRECLSEV